MFIEVVNWPPHGLSHYVLRIFLDVRYKFAYWTKHLLVLLLCWLGCGCCAFLVTDSLVFGLFICAAYLQDDVPPFHSQMLFGGMDGQAQPVVDTPHIDAVLRKLSALQCSSQGNDSFDGVVCSQSTGQIVQSKSVRDRRKVCWVVCDKHLFVPLFTMHELKSCIEERDTRISILTLSPSLCLWKTQCSGALDGIKISASVFGR